MVAISGCQCCRHCASVRRQCKYSHMARDAVEWDFSRMIPPPQNGVQNGGGGLVHRRGTPLLLYYLWSGRTPDIPAHLLSLYGSTPPPPGVHLCLTVECITSGLHLSVFLIRSPPPRESNNIPHQEKQISLKNTHFQGHFLWTNPQINGMGWGNEGIHPPLGAPPLGASLHTASHDVHCKALSLLFCPASAQLACGSTARHAAPLPSPPPA